MSWLTLELSLKKVGVSTEKLQLPADKQVVFLNPAKCHHSNILKLYLWQPFTSEDFGQNELPSQANIDQKASMA